MHRRENLDKYYKKVKVCSLCNLNYGVDKDMEQKGKGICPICLGKIYRKTYVGTEQYGGDSGN